MDTRVFLNQQLQVAWAQSNSAKLYHSSTDTGRQGIRLAIRDIQAALDQAQQALDDLSDHIAELEEAPF